MTLLLQPLPAAPNAPTIPGDPDAVMAGARKLAGIAAEMQGIGNSVDGVRTQTVNATTWLSVGSLSFSSSATELVGWYNNAAAAFGVAAGALATYAAELRQAQHAAQAAQAALDSLEQSRQAHNTRLAAAEADPASMLTQVGQLSAEQSQISGATQQAQQLGGDAVTAAKAAARKAAAALSEAAAMTSAKRRAAAEAAARQQEEADDKPWYSDLGHGILDVAGLVPGFGEAADGLNGLWYSAEGDAMNAGLSFAGMVPFLGWGATGGKLVGKGARAADDAADAADAATDLGRAADVPSTSSRPSWLDEGSQWHRDVQTPLNAGDDVPVRFLDEDTGSVLGGPGWSKELYVHGDSASGYRRVDAYNADQNTILSLKSGQYGTDPAAAGRARAALDELVDKYSPGTSIADVPSTPESLRGSTLNGQLVLGVPVQVDPLPQSVIDHARDLGVRIAEIDIPVTRKTP